MAGQIVVSSIKTDSDNSISFLANTGATIFSANLASGLSASSFGNNTITSDKIVSVANTKISGNIVSSQITSVANTQLTGTITNSQLGTGAVSNTQIASGAVEQYFADTGFEAQFRNRIINGDMRIAQRGTGAVTANDSYPVDRMNIGNSTDGAFSAIQDSDVPAGFNKSIKFTITTADASVTGTQSLFLVHPIEGFNVADLNWGTANAKTVTLSFWVRSSVTGTFSGSLVNNALDRSYPFTYSISVADTWEYKTVTVAGDTTGTWTTDNSTGIRLYFSLGTGATRLGTANTWGAARYHGATGETALVNTINATWYITGVQLEVGSVATPFERRPFGMELALCQRYYAKSYEIGTAPGTDTQTGLIAMRNWDTSSRNDIDIPIIWPVNMRAVPTFTAYSKSGSSGYISEGVDGSFTDKSFNGSYNSSSKGIYAIATGGIGSLAFATLHYTASAEL
jgi:hypothetical protein